MPTGYTAKVGDGTITEFSAFAMQCARAFGATITMRDDPLGKAIPDEFKPEPYYAERVAEASARLKAIVEMTAEEAEVARDTAEAKRSAHVAEMNRRSEAIRARYVAMLERAKRWEPPTREHDALRTFMIEQLEESIKLDCHDYSDEPALPPAQEWHAVELSRAVRNYESASAEAAKEASRVAQRNTWVQALRASLVDQ